MGKGEDVGESGVKKVVAWGDEDDASISRPSKFAKIKGYLGRACLFIGLIIYITLGAWVFMLLESEEETDRKKSILQDIHDARSEFKTAVLSSEAGLNLTLEKYLHSYEDKIDKLFEIDLLKFLEETDVNKIHLVEDWDYPRAVFFATTVITTIGYGDPSPKTDSGRIFCIFFALIGIPFTLTVIADLGKMMASVLKYVYKKFRKHFPKKASASSKLSKKFGKSATVGGSIIILLLYIAAGAGLFKYIEPWNFFHSFYFSFITMTTIGFGDLVPKDTEYLVVFILYIMIGLALTSTVIELVRIQYADSWRKMRELSTRLQGLSGTLRKYGDNINLDVNVLQDLRDLKKALAKSSGRTKREGSIWNKFWENQDGFDMNIVESDEPRLIQITIYESTV